MSPGGASSEGVLRLIILRELQKAGPLDPSELSRAVLARAGIPNRAAIFPCMRELERQGLIRTAPLEAEDGPRRRLTLTPAGLRHLSRALVERLACV